MGSTTLDSPPVQFAARAFTCRCGKPIFFGNTRCLNCDAELGFDPESGNLWALEPAADDQWRATNSDESDRLFKRCDSLLSAHACNWVLPAMEAHSLCRSCRLNRTIPDLSIAENVQRWTRIEVAKRRLVSSLIAHGLPVRSRVSEDADRGVAFDLLASQPAVTVMTGHADGIITMNIEEADDAARERVRTALQEPYRTVLGNLRHEVGHYYWARLIDGTRWIDGFRKLFGDERADYGQALQRHYDAGPPPDWAQRCVSAYACAHPWEDWAETWAHYLHMIDTLDTAFSFGLSPDAVDLQIAAFTLEMLRDTGVEARAEDANAFLALINAWVKLSAVLNEFSRAMGQNDFYPFALAPAAVRKLLFVHRIIASACQAQADLTGDADSESKGGSG